MIYFPSQFFSSFLGRNFCRNASIDLTASLCGIHLFMPLLTWGPLILAYLWVSALRNLKSFWNIPKWIRGMQGQNKYCTCSFFSFTLYQDVLLLSKVFSLQLQLFSWCWLDLIFFFLLLIKPPYLLCLWSILWAFLLFISFQFPPEDQKALQALSRPLTAPCLCVSGSDLVRMGLCTCEGPVTWWWISANTLTGFFSINVIQFLELNFHYLPDYSFPSCLFSCLT